jgi:ribosomal-protein-alanine N-acetyltransferase
MQKIILSGVMIINHLGTQTIETSRLILRKHELTDADDIFRNWVTDPEVSRFWSWQPHKNIDETKSLLADWIEEYSKPDTYHWIIIFKNISQAIGYIYLSEINDIDDSVAVHYALSRKYWNQGIMSEACKRVFQFAFSDLQVKTIHSRHHIDNSASGKVMQKCGMKYTKTEYRQVDVIGEYHFYEIKSDNFI